jgi:hypothetical protein
MDYKKIPVVHQVDVVPKPPILYLGINTVFKTDIQRLVREIITKS